MKKETITANVVACLLFLTATYLFMSLIFWTFYVPNWTISGQIVTICLFMFFILYARHRILLEFRAIKEVDKFLAKNEE